MDLYCWWSHKGHLCLDTEQPRQFPEGSFEHQIPPGGFLGGVGTYCVVADAVKDILPYLPSPGECAVVSLHDLWGKAKEAASYDKKLWVGIQRATEG